MLINALTALIMIPFRLENSFSVVKIYDGNSWNIRGVIRNDKLWDGFIREIRSEKPYYSYGFCCYNDKYIDGIQIEGQDSKSRFVINDLTPNGKSSTFTMYWRPNKTQQLPDEPGYSQTASISISHKMRKFINDNHKMKIATEKSFNNCGGKYYQIPGTDCTYKYELEHLGKYDNLDSTKFSYITKYHVFLNYNRKMPLRDSWVTILDTVGYNFTVPELAIKEYDKMLGVDKYLSTQSKQQIVDRNISLIKWSLDRFECSIMNKKTGKQLDFIRTEGVSIRQGDRSNSYSEFMILNDSIRILIYGFDR
jgi:hypothetical protein